jgi:hypothetical protein
MALGLTWSDTVDDIARQGIPLLFPGTSVFSHLEWSKNNYSRMSHHRHHHSNQTKLTTCYNNQRGRSDLVAIQLDLATSGRQHEVIRDARRCCRNGPILLRLVFVSDLPSTNGWSSNSPTPRWRENIRTKDEARRKCKEERKLLSSPRQASLVGTVGQSRRVPRDLAFLDRYMV